MGYAVPPYIIVAGENHLDSWYDEAEFPPYWRTEVSNSSWTTNERAIDWIRHFEQYTTYRKLGGYHLLILDRYESHYSDEFEE